MKYRIIKIVALLIILIQLTSCFHTVRTDNKRPPHKHYRKAGRYW